MHCFSIAVAPEESSALLHNAQHCYTQNPLMHCLSSTGLCCALATAAAPIYGSRFSVMALLYMLNAVLFMLKQSVRRCGFLLLLCTQFGYAVAPMEVAWHYCFGQLAGDSPES